METLISFASLFWVAFLISSSIERTGGTTTAGGSAPEISDGDAQTAITLTEKQISTFVDKHNEIRRNVSPSASNMRKVTWDDELADIALRYTRKCIFHNNPNANHSRFPAVGEIIYLSQNVPFRTGYIERMITEFTQGKNQYNVRTRACSGSPSDCGRYAQMIWAETFKIGCGITHCRVANSREEAIRGAIITVCNYAPSGDWKARSPYVSGTPCSACAQTDVCEKKLCTNSIRDSSETPVGVWTNWSNWSPCSGTCGQTSKRRSRVCNTFVRSDCVGVPVEISLFCAPVITCPSSKGNWETWNSWTACSKSCGGGRRSRIRQCDTGNNQQCDGSSVQLGLCNQHLCQKAVRAPWLDWDQWSTCSKTCGGGTRYRSRTCSSQNLFQCCGTSHEVRNCNAEPCPVPTWNAWGRWFDVGDSCSSDTQVRKRRCSTGRSEDCCKNP